MTDERFMRVPDGWEVAAPERLARGVDIAQSVLDRPGVVDDVATYYQRESNYAGATYLDLDPSTRTPSPVAISLPSRSCP